MKFLKTSILLLNKKLGLKTPKLIFLSIFQRNNYLVIEMDGNLLSYC